MLLSDIQIPPRIFLRDSSEPQDDFLMISLFFGVPYLSSMESLEGKGKKELVNVSQRSKGVPTERKLLQYEHDPATIMRKNSKKLFSHIKGM